jgi:hypothetical protein
MTKAEKLLTLVEREDNEIGLWQYNNITGYWKLGRMCNLDTADQWLKVWQKDDPKDQWGHAIFYKLSKNRPNNNPWKK